MKISFPMLFGTLFAGILYGVGAEYLYDWMREEGTPSYVITLVYMLGLFIVMGLAVTIINNACYSRYTGGIHKKSFIVSIILILLLSVGFEFIYDVIAEINVFSNSCDTYIFVVDNSGSMAGNDPKEDRFDAIEEILEDEDDDVEFAIYTFSTYVYLSREMGPISDGFDYDRHNDGGGTGMYTALSQVLADIDDDVTEISGNTKVILLTDGDPGDVSASNKKQWGELMEEFADRDIPVNTIAFKYANDDFMEFLADETGGVYINCDDVDELSDSVGYAINYNREDRNLLGKRKGDTLNALLAAVRVLFVGILGVVIALQKSALCEKFVNTTSVIVSSAIAGILAGICIEVGMNGLDLDDWLMRIFTCALIGFTVLRVDLLNSNNGDDILYNGGRF